ncbi:MAG: tRNA (cytidine(34)-2'-O)-methyltransferase [Planctomycetota bacterium]
MLHIALYQPIIPQNVGNIARTCVGMDAHLHIIGPTIVDLSDKAVKRAGLDYWDDLVLTQHESPEAFFGWTDAGGMGVPPVKITNSETDGRDARPTGTMYAVTKFATTRFDKPPYRDNDILLFGSEREGLPAEVHKKFDARQKIAIPIPGAVRSYNLANTVAITLAVAMSRAELWPEDWVPKDGYTPPNTFTLGPD